LLLTIQQESHTIHIENPAVNTNIITIPTSFVSIKFHARAKITVNNPTKTNTAKTMDPVINGVVSKFAAAWDMGLAIANVMCGY
jgi:hypothetical protein